MRVEVIPLLDYDNYQRFIIKIKQKKEIKIEIKIPVFKLVTIGLEVLDEFYNLLNRLKIRGDKDSLEAVLNATQSLYDMIEVKNPEQIFYQKLLDKIN